MLRGLKKILKPNRYQPFYSQSVIPTKKTLKKKDFDDLSSMRSGLSNTDKTKTNKTTVEPSNRGQNRYDSTQVSIKKRIARRWFIHLIQIYLKYINCLSFNWSFQLFRFYCSEYSEGCHDYSYKNVDSSHQLHIETFKHISRVVFEPAVRITSFITSIASTIGGKLHR